jgi:hypothetical protein
MKTCKDNLSSDQDSIPEASQNEANHYIAVVIVIRNYMKIKEPAEGKKIKLKLD